MASSRLPSASSASKSNVSKSTLSIADQNESKHASEVWRKHMQSRWLESLAVGAKKFEGRLAYSDWASVKEGQRIVFWGEIDEVPTEIPTKVTSVRKFANFSEMLVALGVSSVLPGVSKPEEGAEIYEKIYPAKSQKDYGVLAIGIVRCEEADT